uniref:Zf-Tim10_DDP domain-containing protein n=1 Tax=Angiostrongylus cantonensis TaxID=6313 RepID=A0A0K0D258_ANGCA
LFIQQFVGALKQKSSEELEHCYEICKETKSKAKHFELYFFLIKFIWPCENHQFHPF